MADTLVERLTGQATAEAVPIAVQLVVSDAALLAAGSEPALVLGGGPVPAAVARTLTANALDADAAWLRRIYAGPTGRITATSSQDRFFAGGLADLLRVRDLGICRTPWCDAPIRHLDHVIPAERGGPTDQENGQGLCEACNHAKQAPGWTQSTVSAVDAHTVQTVTPTGHRYGSAGTCGQCLKASGRTPCRRCGLWLTTGEHGRHQCGPTSTSVRTVSGGAPSLGKR